MARVRRHFFYGETKAFLDTLKQLTQPGLNYFSKNGPYMK